MPRRLSKARNGTLRAALLGCRATIPKAMAPEAVSLDLAIELLSWPRDLGCPTEALLQSLTTGSPGDNASQSEQQPAASSQAQHMQPAVGEMVQAGLGRFGPFVKQGDVFASIPKASWWLGCCLWLSGPVLVSFACTFLC